jgi:uncharacterized protein YecE (DUF72 family)
MEFGSTDGSLEVIDFTLPPDTETTTKTLSTKKSEGDLTVYVGAPKWVQKGWLGKVYPNKLPDKEFLRVYAENFNTVEFSPTFYSICKPAQIKAWTDQVKDSPNFKFCPKFPQSITHVRRLSNAEQQTDQFYQSLNGFGDHLGPLLLQLGPNFSPKSFPQLRAYLETLPPSIKVSIEVRHQDWFSVKQARNDLFNLLYDLNIGSVISDTSARRDCVHMELTTTDAVIRFVGNNLDDSDYRRMDEWVQRIKHWTAMGLKNLWFFMHQNDERFVPEACVYLINQLNAAIGTSITPPKIME